MMTAGGGRIRRMPDLGLLRSRVRPRAPDGAGLLETRIMGGAARGHPGAMFYLGNIPDDRGDLEGAEAAYAPPGDSGARMQRSTSGSCSSAAARSPEHSTPQRQHSTPSPRTREPGVKNELRAEINRPARAVGRTVRSLPRGRRWREWHTSPSRGRRTRRRRPAPSSVRPGS